MHQGPDATWRLVIHHHRRLRNLARHHDLQADPDQIVNDAAIATVSSSSNRWASDDDFLKYISVAIRNAAHAEHRRGRPSLEREQVQPGPEDPLVLFLDRELAADRAAAVRRLVPQQRLALFLEALGYRRREIAALTGWTERAVDGKLRRARARLATSSPSTSSPACASAPGASAPA